MKIYLPQHSAVIEIDDADLPAFSAVRWHISRPNGHEYVAGRVDGKYVMLHRYLTNAPKGLVVDHIDGNGLNNTRANLRICTHRQNLWNRDFDKGGGGIIFRRGKWEAGMHVDGRYVCLGTFGDEITAKAARDFVSVRLRGEYGSLHGADLSYFDPLLLSYTARQLIAAAS